MPKKRERVEPMINTENIILAQYSRKLDSYDVCSLADSVMNNRADLLRKSEGDYLAIGVFASV